MKKICAILFAAMLAGQAWAQTSFEIDNLKYTVTDGTNHYVSVGQGSTAPTGAINILGKVTNPNDGEEYTVTSINHKAFSNCTGLTSVTIPNSVTSISEQAFSYCGKLAGINVENNNANYESENGVLFNKGKTNLICFPAGKTETTYTIPNSVTSISVYAFSGCKHLTSVDIPNSVTSIGYAAFAACKALEKISLPFVGDKAHSATDTYQYPFGYIFGTTSYSGGTPATQYFYGDRVGTTINAKYYIPSSLREVIITGCNYITRGAFGKCYMLTSITIPNTVTGIGDGAFNGCSGLTSVTIPDSVTDIGEGAFHGCSGLTSVTIPNSVTSIGDKAFIFCDKLTSISIPDGVTSIGSNAFASCGRLQYNEYDNALYLGNEDNPYVWLMKAKSTDITTCEISSSCKYIYEGAFSGCSGLTSISIPEGVTNIKPVLDGCGILQYNEYGNALYLGNDENQYVWLMKAKSTDITTCEISSNCKYIYEGAFSGCNGLTSVIVPNSVTYIGWSAFYGCNSLKSITLPFVGTKPLADAMTDGRHHFYGENVQKYWCASIFSPNNMIIALPETLKEIIISDGRFIAESAFYVGCEEVTTISIPNTITYIAHDAFRPDGKLQYNEYDNAYYLGNDENPYVCLVKAKSTDITSCEINSNCKFIYSYAFYNCGKLTSITIPDGVKGFGDEAFRECYGLKSIIIPNSVSIICQHAFSGCGFNKIVIPESVEIIGPYFISKCRIVAILIMDGTNITCNEDAFADLNYNYDRYDVYCEGSGNRIDRRLLSYYYERYENCKVIRTAVNNAKYGDISTSGNYAIKGDDGSLWYLANTTNGTATLTATARDGYHFVRWEDDEDAESSRTIDVTGSKTYKAIFEAHTEVVDAAVAATCTAPGKTEGKHCSVCNAVLEGLEVIPALDHAYDTVPFAPTCTNLGYKELTCTRCNDVIYIDTVAATGHSYSNTITAPTCTEVGYTTHVCSVCEYEYNSDTVAANGHTEVVDVAIATTCTTVGKTEGKHCSVCEEVLVAQEEVAALGHTEVTDAAVAATCTAPGKTEGKHCSVCNTVLVEQQEVEALGHKFEKYTYNNDATTAADGTETATCTRGCGATDTRVAEGTKLAETPEKGTAVSEVASTLNIYAHGNIIVIENATNEISVYNAMGILICRDAIHRVRAEINVSAPGIYIVKVGGTAKRVMVN